MTILISNATIVNEGVALKGHLVIEKEVISKIYPQQHTPCGDYDLCIDATGCVVMPGVIDTHVHFREPGLTRKADIRSESRAAAWGGVTSYFDMPNTVPQTVTAHDLEEKFALAREKSSINFSFFPGATNDNAHLFKTLDPHRIPGIKLFMGSSTGNMLVDHEEALREVFANAGQLPIVAHCEDTDIINRRMREMVDRYGDDPDVMLHAKIRSEEACYTSTAKAVAMAREYGSHLHVAHLTTARELELFEPCTDETTVPLITAEAVIAHLYFSEMDVKEKGALIKCNPSVKTQNDRDTLRRALCDGRIYTVATDHAPHCLSEKQGGCRKAASGMPMVQFSLPAMLQLVDEGILSVERVVQLMCHHPAMLFQVSRRGFLREGYQADIAIVRPASPWRVTDEVIQSKCGWSPMTGRVFNWRVEHTLCNGRLVYSNGRFDDQVRGQEIRFRQ